MSLDFVEKPLHRRISANANLTNFLIMLFANYTRITTRKYAHSLASVLIWTVFVMPLKDKPKKKPSEYPTFAKHIRLMRIAARILESIHDAYNTTLSFPISLLFPDVNHAVTLYLLRYSDIIVWIDRTSRLLSTSRCGYQSFSRRMYVCEAGTKSY